MQPFNIEKIKAGAKTTTTRSQREFEKIGIPIGQSATVNFGGQNFTVTNRGLLTIQEAGGEEAMLKSEGYTTVDDLLYQQTKDWFGGRGKLYVYDIKSVVQQTETKITTPSGKLKLKDGKEYLISDINAALLEKIGYKPKEIGKLLKSIC